MKELKTKLIELGVLANDANILTEQIKQDLKTYTKEHCWQTMVQKVLPFYPFPVHEVLYKTIYPDWNKMPAPAWFPTQNFIETTHIGQLIKEKNFKDYKTLHRWSIENYSDFWDLMIKKLSIKFDIPYQTTVDLNKGIEFPVWFPKAKLNIIKSCFQAKETHTAIISETEQGHVIKTSYSELNKLSSRVANSLSRFNLKKGDSIAVIMPMTREAIIIYLGIIKAGFVVVSIADSFSTEEIKIRLNIAKVKAVFTQEYILREKKALPLYQKIIEAKAPFSIVLPTEKSLTQQLRKQDISWENFLIDDEIFTPVSSQPEEYINILFSSGTTGEPKAIPWTQTTPIKCAVDAYLHHNIQPADTFCWPTNLGWMMGPWLIFATLINQATIALYEGTPNNQHFGKFIQNTPVTLLGLVPTLVKTWRHSACMEGLDWSKIKLFSSTGECSNIEDMLYLMSLAHYRPIIEYCGGTEIGGAYITGTVVQPSAPAACTTPALGLDFMMINEKGVSADNGEVLLIPPSLGLSTELLNKNHHQVYYADVPQLPGYQFLRRHGDQIQRYSNGFYRLQGRIDDTMNLSGIKISSVEIESVLNTLPSLYETAAIAVEPNEGGPNQLIIYVVPRKFENFNKDQLKQDLQNAIKQHLNPLFKIYEIMIVDILPRTASNKVMRRVLREHYQQTKEKNGK